MESSRWERIQSLFHAASDLPAAQRREALLAACSDDASLVEEVLGMLAADSESALLLDRPLAQVAETAFCGASGSALKYEQIGPYQIQRVLGEGGMGIVFLAKRPDLNAFAAIKILRDAWISPARRQRFAQEQRFLAQFNHPNIARLLDADTLPDGTPYFVMEYVDGLPLDTYCERNHCSMAERIELFRSVCQAVQFAHQHAVIHRDLKPSNILVTPDGTVKLLDFGIAKQLDTIVPPVDQTRTVFRLLTPAYASPEQMSGAQVGLHTDVYSLGVVLYQLMAGRVPFDVADLSASQALAALVEREPVRPSLVAKRVHAQSHEGRNIPSAEHAEWEELDVLCLTAIHKDLQKRYASVEALGRDVDHYLRGERLEARPDTFAYRLRKFIGRHRLSVFAAAAALTGILALTTFFTWRLATERNAALAEAARTQRIQRFMFNLFQGGDKAAGPASDMRVSTLLERGVVEARALHQDPAIQAEFFETLGDMYHRLGNLENADTLLRASLERRRVMGTGVGESLDALGLLRLSQARLNDAERLTRAALETSKRTLPAGHPSVAAAYDALGAVLSEKGSYDQAAPLFKEAIRLRSAQPGSDGDLAASLSGLASADFYAGRYSESQALYQRALSINRQVYGDRHPLVGDTLSNLGAIEQNLGQYKRAEELHRQALAINRAFYGENHYETASSMTMVARALVYQNRDDEALALLRQSLAVQEHIFGAMHPRVASALNELGNVAVSQRRFAEASSNFQRMAAIYRAVYGPGHHLVATATSNLGGVYLKQKNYREAEQRFREALAIYTRTLPNDHVDIGIVRSKLGRALLRQKRYAEAETETLIAYRIIGQQVTPSVSWLKSARSDLAEIYDALHQPDKAAVYRTEVAQLEQKR